MSYTQGPTITQDNLLLHVDAANVKSFRGEPTVNLFDVSNPYFSAAYWDGNYAFGDASSMIDQTAVIVDGISTTKIKRSPAGIGVNKYEYLYFPFGTYATGATAPYDSKTYSFDYYGTKGNSLYFYINAGSTDFSSTIENSVISYPIYSITIPVTENEWQRVDLTINNSTPDLVVGWMILHYDIFSTILTADDYYLFRNVQLEMKDHPTPHVNGTRGSTVELGGGWKNLKTAHGGELHNVLFENSNKGSISFNGVDSYISFVDYNISPTSAMTWECMFKGATSAGYRPLFSKGQDNGVSPFVGLYFSPDSMIPRLGASDIGSNTRAIDYNFSSTAIELNTYTHLALTYDGSVFCLYKNGVLSETSSAWTYGFINTADLEIGRFWAGYWNGNISNFKIYGKVLSESEIACNFNAIKNRYGI